MSLERDLLKMNGWVRVVTHDSICTHQQEQDFKQNKPLVPAYGWALPSSVAVVGQAWITVLWDGNEDPDICKAGCLMRIPDERK